MLIDDVESDVRANHKSEVTSKELGDLVLKRLRDLDKVAYIRFASVYKEFNDLESFTAELEKLSS